MGGVGAVIGVIGSVIGAVGKIKEASEAKKQAARNAEMEAENTARQLELTAQEQAYQQSMARARAAASGVGGETTDIYMEAMERAGAKELDWISKVGAANYANELARGRSAAAGAWSGFWGNITKAGSGISSIFG